MTIDNKSKKPDNIILIVSLLPLLILGNVLYEFYQEYNTNKVPFEISYSEWISNRPENKYLEINDVEADILNSMYLESLLHKEKKPDKIFIPLIPKDSQTNQSKVSILLSVNEGPLYDRFTKLVSMTEEEIMNDVLVNPKNYKISGPFKCYEQFNSEINEELQQLDSNLSSDFVIMELNGGFFYFAALIPFLIFMSIVVFVIYQITTRIRRK